MKFNSKIDLSIHFKELENDGYITSEWILKPNDDGGTIGTRMYKINFAKLDEENDN